MIELLLFNVHTSVWGSNKTIGIYISHLGTTNNKDRGSKNNLPKFP